MAYNNQSFLNRVLFIIFFIFSFHVKADYLLWESESNEIACDVQSSTVWVDQDGIKNCVQYFISNKNTNTAIIQFYGDRDISAKKNINEIKNNTYHDQLNIVKNKSDVFNMTYIVIARLGTYGSSGSYKNKRELIEFETISYAIDEIKNKYEFENIVVVGHSGGATVGAALLTLGREDIQCAVLSSGTYNYMPREVNRIMSRQKDYDFSKIPTIMRERYDPIFHTENIYYDENRKVFIVGNEKDKNTPFNLQVSFAWKLISEGHNNTHVITADAEPPMYHNIFNINKYISLCF